MTFGIDISGSGIRWVRSHGNKGPQGFGFIPFKSDSPTPGQIKGLLKDLFRRERTESFVFPLYGPNVRAKFFTSDKVAISELEDNVAWEARFFLGYDNKRDVLSFDPLRSIGNQIWIVAAAAPLREVNQQTDLFPFPPCCVETALTALANAVLESSWGKKDVMVVHLDRSRGFLVVITHGNPVLMQEIPDVALHDVELSEKALSKWSEELKLRRNFLPQDNRNLDYLLLSGDAGTVPENSSRLAESLGLEGTVFNPFQDFNISYKPEQHTLFSVAYGCSLRGEDDKD